MAWSSIHRRLAGVRRGEAMLVSFSLVLLAVVAMASARYL
jgi:hypothetical protein